MMTIQLFIVWVNVKIGAKNIDNAMQCFYHIINNCEDDSVKSKAQAYIELLNDNSEDNG